MRAETHAVAITTDGSAAFTGYTPVINGRVLEIRFVNVDLAATLDVAVTNEVTGAAVLTLTDQNGSGTWAPRQPTHSIAGAAALYAGGGAAVNDHIVVAQSRIKVVCAQGGNVKTGTLYITVG